LIYLVSFSVFSAVIISLVLFLLLLEAGVAPKGSARIFINDDPDRVIETRLGTTLLAALSEHDIFLPSACGGSGACGQCRCRVESGGGDIQPTELNHLTRQEKRDHVRLARQLKGRGDTKTHVA